jgi:hypothetical protein
MVVCINWPFKAKLKEKYRVIHKPSRTSELSSATTKIRHSRKEHISR